jgi:DNA-directed RNA polymerase subunit M/transcription elongation factor TFIIS
MRQRPRDEIINKIPIPIYKNTARHDRRAANRTVRFGKTCVFTGLKHQCVELARRWCVRSKGATFREVDNASDMISIRSGKCLTCGHPVRISVSTTVTPSSILAGDLLVWKRGLTGSYRKTGHVAVVINVDNNNNKIIDNDNHKDNDNDNGNHHSAHMNIVTVAEQNGSTKNGHRKINLNHSKTRRALAGRMRMFSCTRCGGKRGTHFS